MNIIILMIICAAMAAQIIDASEQFLEIKREQRTLKPIDLFIFRSNNIDPKKPLNISTVEALTKIKLQDRQLQQYRSPNRSSTLLIKNYRWEKMVKESSDNEPKRTHRGEGCIKWHQLPIDKDESIENDLAIESFSGEKNLITIGSIRVAQERVKEISRARQKAYKKSQDEAFKLFHQETFGIITPIAALASLKKEQTNGLASLVNIEETEGKIANTISRLKKVLPLDLLQLLSNNSDVRTNLFCLLQTQAQQESMSKEKEKTVTYLKELEEKEKTEIKLLQDGIINFDRSALSDEQLRQKARLEKIRATLDENPELNAQDITITDEEYATFVFNYRKTLVLGNLIGEQELAIVQSACPKILTPMANRSIVAQFNEKAIAKPCAQRDSSSDTEEEDLDISGKQEETCVNSDSSSSSSSSSSSGYFNWWS